MSDPQNYLQVHNLVKYFGDDRAVDDISFSIPRGHFLTLLGPSGCGKTTTLMSIAGLHKIDSGTIIVGDKTYTSPEQGLFLPPEQRDIGMVFQSYAIWPHMTIAQNVAYPLEIRRVPRDEINDRVADVLQLVGLTDFADKLATQLSGGQQQRASLARAIVSNPRLLLFDEPLSNLDLKLREQMRVELKRIQKEVGSLHLVRHHSPTMAVKVPSSSSGRMPTTNRSVPLSRSSPNRSKRLAHSPTSCGHSPTAPACCWHPTRARPSSSPRCIDSTMCAWCRSRCGPRRRASSISTRGH